MISDTLGPMSSDVTQIPIHATPKAQRNAVAGVKADDTGRLEVQVRVTVAPEGGKANKAVCETLAKAIGVSKSKVSIVRGETSRHKMAQVEAPSADIEAWMDGLPRL
ncbi:DUF167 domain-containing protein [Slackia heliotrinireducens]|uniref:UPF0235 protein Shel_02050 n=1 Tax=Slackia heliotrinireducens (strain ATCC 29202 / DSM 20476 / NCTC 11029 / RHS 1) TaxID=471855 RepID=C7N1I3_SLAHD|nr:DUF167 domain-containing protein [Slackia heliotrinireducens]ACV21275.1 uncharacterized conserved protein [Slackia heliotrinireducens DSM 20476]